MTEQHPFRAETPLRMAVRGIRGAVTVERDEPAQILDATERLVRAMVERNHLQSEDIASALFTVTPDLHSEFPAAATRRMGWTFVPLLNFTEIGVPGSLERCIRVLVHVNTEAGQDEIEHVYLEGAVTLRPDLAKRS
jgi:chorismate mutase